MPKLLDAPLKCADPIGLRAEARGRIDGFYGYPNNKKCQDAVADPARYAAGYKRGEAERTP